MSAAEARLTRRQSIVSSAQQRRDDQCMSGRLITHSSRGTTALTALASAITTILLTTCLAIGISILLTPETSPRRDVPSDATQVFPMPCHSHNDYWRRRPLFSALETGCIGIEADVWHFEGDLYVAHTEGSMQPGRTLQNMYIDPLLRLLEVANSGGAAPSSSSSSCGGPNGLYATLPSQTVVLLLDIKADAERTWPILFQQLKPLRGKCWLSTLREDGQIDSAPITVVLTGDIRRTIDPGRGFDRPRDGMFLDAPLAELRRGADISPSYHNNSSYWASTSLKKSIGLGWFGGLGSSRLEKIRQQIQVAHSHGLQARYWGLPSWPMGVRHGVWETLLAEGLDILNVDDLTGFSDFWTQYADAREAWTGIHESKPV